MPTKYFDQLNARINKPLTQFWDFIYNRFGSAKMAQATYYIHAAFTLTLYSLFLGYPLAFLRRLALNPNYAPPADQINNIGLLIAFSAVILPLFLTTSHRLRLQYKAEYTTRKAATYSEAFRLAILEIKGVDLDTRAIETAFTSADLTLSPQLGPLSELDLLHAIFDDWRIPRTLSSGRQILNAHQRLDYLINLHK